MDREPHAVVERLLETLGKQLPKTNFYRFCQLVEQVFPESKLGAGQTAQADPVRFYPHPGMGFPAAEFKSARIPEAGHERCSLRTTFMGLYGVTSPLPTTYVDYIAQNRPGSDELASFLDIFNHRLMTQFYRIWRKYSYTATFEAGGVDRTSGYLLGLIGLGIDGSGAHIATPASRFLGLLGIMRLPTRTAEGIVSLARQLAPETRVSVVPHDKRRLVLSAPLRMSSRQPVALHQRPVLGAVATDVNSQVLIKLTPQTREQALEWLPDGQLYADFMALLQVYLGARLHARLELEISAALLPPTRLRAGKRRAAQLGMTAVLQTQNNRTANERMIRVALGRYQGLKDSPYSRERQHYANYRF